MKKDEVQDRIKAKEQVITDLEKLISEETNIGKAFSQFNELQAKWNEIGNVCLLYTSDAADERSSVDLGGRRIIKKKKKNNKNDDRTHVRRTELRREISRIRRSQDRWNIAVMIKKESRGREDK